MRRNDRTRAPWFEDDDPRDLKRWAIAALIVVGIHLAAIAAYVYVHRPDEHRRRMPRRLRWSSRRATTPSIRPKSTPVPEQVAKAGRGTAAATRPIRGRRRCRREKPLEQPSKSRNRRRRPCRRASKAARRRFRAILADELVKHLQQFKRYPSDAQSRGEEGIVLLSFSVDRTGHVLAHQIARSSGHPRA